MRILTDSEQRHIAQLVDSAQRIVQDAKREDSNGRLEAMCETIRDMVVEASRIAHKKTPALKRGFAGEGDVTIPDVECETNEHDTVYTVYTLRGEAVDVTPLFVALGIGEDLEADIWNDVTWHERRYGDADLRIEREREATDG